MVRPCVTLNDAIVGRVYPQIQEWKRLPDDPLATFGDLNSGLLHDWTGPLPTLLVAKGAKLSDLLSSGPTSHCGLLLSTKMRTVLEGFALGEHRYIPAPLEHRQQSVEGYWLLHLPAPVIPATEGISPTEMEALIQADPELATVDLLHLERPARYAYWFVSQPLKTALEVAGVTGVRFGTAKIFR